MVRLTAMLLDIDTFPEVLGVAAVVEVSEAPAGHHGLASCVLVLLPVRPGETRGLDVGPLGQLHLLRQHQHTDVVLILCREPSEVKYPLQNTCMIDI